MHSQRHSPVAHAISTSPSSCGRGTTFDLRATFETTVTANSRYDAGFFFRIDGGSNARGDGPTAAGQCSLSGLSTPPPPNPLALNLDGDNSGDLNAGIYNVTFTIPGVLCEDRYNDGLLNLPSLTADVTDDEGVDSTPSGDATVTVNTTP